MLCENKFTNLVFKNQENGAKHNLLPFPFFFNLFFNIILLNKTPRMKYMNVMQCKSQKQKNKKPNNNGHKGNSNKAQGPCQKDSIS